MSIINSLPAELHLAIMKRMNPEEIQPWIRANPDAFRCFSTYSFTILKKYTREIGLMSDLQNRVCDYQLTGVQVHDASNPSAGPKSGITSKTTSLGCPATQVTTLALLRLLVEARVHRRKANRLRFNHWWGASFDQQLWTEERRISSMFVDLLKRTPGNHTTALFMAMFDNFVAT
ncbi:hypothetical protein CaCOL14_000226 [Colletotrichum acutatum]|uniref:F-box domain-containing protein n=1 Tax=Glomerella acutata TaxID=27357 RepID=A0AAD8UWE4_GLOAC|nr:uncharacterized protein BDZ83DRAFT_748974 [Colletotrichum acutatum]KAK1728561.1 hypothetical protein BDZ83DRAFT_748974 [Colletotrichum acutatum]